MKVLLTKQEVFMAAMCGVMRNFGSMFRGLKANHGYSGDYWGIHIEGAAGEFAAAKALGVFWSPTVNSYKSADIAPNIQVRTRSKSDYDLIIREDDNPDHAYVLVVGQSPEFEVIGWIWGRDGKRPEWIKTYGGRPPAWFVPQDKLRPLSELTT